MQRGEQHGVLAGFVLCIHAVEGLEVRRQLHSILFGLDGRDTVGDSPSGLMLGVECFDQIDELACLTEAGKEVILLYLSW